MTVSIIITGQLKLDQTAGLQQVPPEDDVEVSVDGGGALTGALDSDFLTYLNTLPLTADQKNFADLVEGASDPDLVSITADAGETIGKLFFSDAAGEDFDGDPVELSPGVPLTTIDGEALFLWSALNGKVVLAKTADGDIAAAFYIEPTNAAHTTAVVQSITFVPLAHPNPNNPDDSVDFSDILRVSAVVTTPIGDKIVVDDDGPTIATSGTPPTLTVDETLLGTDDDGSYVANFTSAFGTDRAGTLTYAFSIKSPNVDSGIVDTATDDPILLRIDADGNIEGYLKNNIGLLAFEITLNEQTGAVHLDQQRAVVHPTDDPDEPKTLSAADLIRITATIVDKDGDHQSAFFDIGQNFVFEDDGPSIDAVNDGPSLTVDETVFATNDTKDFSGAFSSVYGNDGAGTIAYTLGVTAVASGLVDTLTGQAVNLSVVSGVVFGKTAVSGIEVFKVSVDSVGMVTLDQSRAVIHDPNVNANDVETLAADNLITLTATITDKDGDQDLATINIGQNLNFVDDGPTITAAFDADPTTPLVLDTPELLLNALDATASGTFGYDIGHDAHLAASYPTVSDFVDADAAKLNVQLTLTGTVDNAQNPGITSADVTRTAESATSATFAFSFNYDKDPITAGVQDATAGGTLAFDKVMDTYTFTLTDVIDGFSFDVLHTNELLAKAPTGNTGHPLIVAEQLTPNGDPDPFFVQFTANTTTQQIGFGFNSTGDGAPVGDTTFNNGGATHDMITNTHEDWVSATQSTNGVAGDTIQKGEVLTLRFFQEDILGDVNPNAPDGGTEQLNPTAKASGVVVKFDGVGNSEDLVVILDLKDADGIEITRAVNVQNSDLIKGNANIPPPYNTEFTLDNNDALLILEANDYNDGIETFQIQGLQIMQSANGLSGMAINLDGAVGVDGDSPATSGLGAFDLTDNDVLKIVDIGFVQQTSGTIDASLDFSFKIADADQDLTGIQHIFVDTFIV